MIKKLSIITLISICYSCSFESFTPKKSDLKLEQISFKDLPGWQNDDQSKTIIALLNSCNQLAKMADDKVIGNKVGNIKIGDFHRICDIALAMKGVEPEQARKFFENWFVPFEVSDTNLGNKGLFTGYYVPEIKGSKVKTAIYQYPIYSRPKDLTKEPYFTREEIENGALKNKNLEIAYLDNKVDIFFMQVQGSGRVVLEEGSVMRLGFAGKNNRPYSSIGRYIIDNHIISDGNVSYFSIKNWLKNNQEQAEKIMNVNQSYVFFKASNNDDVIGSQGSPLIAERSLAIDTDILPLGFPIWLNIDSSKMLYQKLLVTQDTGSAIKGAVRGDVFFGKGREAEKAAAQMNYKGKYYILVPASALNKVIREK